MATIDRRGATVSAADPAIGTSPNPDLAVKAPARVATTGTNITLSGVQAIDGVTVGNANERVLVKDQADARTNGLYNAQSGLWQRTIDADNTSQFASGVLVVITSGAANAGKTYELATADPIVLGTSNLSYSLLAVASANFVGDSGTGGAAGLVPAPPAGSAAANKFLSADGSFAVPAAALGAVNSVIGADPTGVADSTAAFQQAVDLGGVVIAPPGTFLFNGTVTITKPVRLIGAGGNLGNGPAGTKIITASPTADIFRVNAWNVRIEGFNLVGTNGARYAVGQGRAIAVGTDSVAGSDGVISGAGATFSSASITFTSADIGKNIDIANAGGGAGIPLVTVIIGLVDPHTVTLANSGALAGGYGFRYGNMYSGLTFSDIFTNTNHAVGIHLVNAAAYLIDNSNISGFYGAQIENEIAPDTGDSYIRSSGFNGDNTNGYGIYHLSGGGLKLLQNIFGTGKYSYFSNWLTGGSGNLLAVANKFEGYQQAAMFFSGSGALAFTGIEIVANRFGGGGPGSGQAVVGFDPALSGNLYSNVLIAANIFDPPASTTSIIDLQRITNAWVNGNYIKGNGATNGIAVGSASTGIHIADNDINGCTSEIADSSQAALIARPFNPPAGYVNKFRNGTMDVFARGPSGTITAGSPAYTADGWIVSATGANPTWAQVAGRSLTRFSLQLTGATSLTDVSVKQRIEGAMASPLAGQAITFQAWVFNGTGATITPTLTVRHANSVDNWGASTVDVNAQALQACANNAWTQVRLTFGASASAGNGLEVLLDFGTVLGSGAKTVQVTELDIRVAFSVQPAELRPLAVEDVLCKRYFRRIGGNTLARYGAARTTSTTNGELIFPLVNPMYLAPTVTVNNVTHWSVNDASVNAAASAVASTQTSTDTVNVNLTCAAVTANRPAFFTPSNADATMDFSAEL